MRVILVYNPTAGNQRHDSKELVALIEDAGHDVVKVVSRKDELADALRAGCDLVAVAGGDGTVGKAASVVTGTRVPLAILPAGTANNMANTIGLSGELSAVVADWAHSEARGFDAAVAVWGDGAGQRCTFYEAFGLGAFPAAMVGADRLDEEMPLKDAEAALRRDRVVLRDVASTAPVRDYRITIDGEDHSGAYLLVEAMLIPCIGPNVAIAPGIDPHDGLLDFVLVPEEERARLVAELDELVDGRPVKWRLDHMRGRHAVIEVDDGRFHADGDLCEDDAGACNGGRIELVATADAFRMLVPPRAAAPDHTRGRSPSESG
jgi:diacylglycerol kinase family enzyme